MSIHSWFDYYLKNPKSLSYNELYTHASENKELHGRYKYIILQMIEKTKDASQSSKRYIARQEEAAVLDPTSCNYYYAEEAVEILQDYVDEVKKAIWCYDSDSKLRTLSKVVAECYSIAQMVNVNLDKGIMNLLDDARAQQV